jgi:hypothetical protein
MHKKTGEGRGKRNWACCEVSDSWLVGSSLFSLCFRIRCWVVLGGSCAIEFDKLKCHLQHQHTTCTPEINDAGSSFPLGIKPYLSNKHCCPISVFIWTPCCMASQSNVSLWSNIQPNGIQHLFRSHYIWWTIINSFNLYLMNHVWFTQML